MYALNLSTDNHILSACVVLQSTPETMPRVDALPDGDINDWLFVNGEYVYDPLPVPPTPEPEPTADEILNALLGVETDE